VPKLFEVSSDHGQRKEHSDGLATRFGIWCQPCPGNLLYGDEAKCAFYEFFSTSWKDKPFLACPCVCNLRRRKRTQYTFYPGG